MKGQSKLMSGKLNPMIFLGLLTIITMLITSCQPTAAPAPSGSTEAVQNAEPAATVAAPDIGDTILLPWIGPLSGPDGALGQDTAIAAQLAVDQVNAAGGICGEKKLMFKAYDNKNDPKEAANVAEIIADQDNVVASINDMSSAETLAEAPILEAAHIVSVSYYAAAPNLPERAGQYHFRIYPSAENQAVFFADYLINKKGYKTFGIIYENLDFGINLSKITEEEIIKRGGEVVVKDAIVKDQIDLSATLSKFKAADPDVVIGYIIYQAASYFVLQAEKIKFDKPVYGFDGFYAPEFIELAGEKAEGVYSLAAYSLKSTNPLVADFVNSFQQAFGFLPNNPAGFTYDAAQVIIRGLKETNCAGRDAMKEWFDTEIIGKTYPGITGTILFPENRDRGYAEGMFTLVVVKDGEWVEAEK